MQPGTNQLQTRRGICVTPRPSPLSLTRPLGAPKRGEGGSTPDPCHSHQIPPNPSIKIFLFALDSQPPLSTFPASQLSADQRTPSSPNPIGRGIPASQFRVPTSTFRVLTTPCLSTAVAPSRTKSHQVAEHVQRSALDFGCWISPLFLRTRHQSLIPVPSRLRTR
jgi:hypothetical protein